MYADHLATLSKALDKLIEDRRVFAAKLAGPGEPEERERWRPMFTQIQQSIEAAERAIRDEQKRGEAELDHSNDGVVRLSG